MPTSTKVTPIRKAKSVAEMDQRQLVDHYAELDRQVKAFEPVIDAHKIAKDALQKLSEKTPGDTGLVLKGNTWQVQFGPRSSERTITDQAAAFKLIKTRLGEDGAIAAVTIPLGLVDRVATESEQKAFIAKEASGTRRMQAVLMNPLPTAA